MALKFAFKTSHAILVKPEACHMSVVAFGAFWPLILSRCWAACPVHLLLQYNIAVWACVLSWQPAGRHQLLMTGWLHICAMKHAARSTNAAFCLSQPCTRAADRSPATVYCFAQQLSLSGSRSAHHSFQHLPGHNSECQRYHLPFNSTAGAGRC